MSTRSAIPLDRLIHIHVNFFGVRLRCGIEGRHLNVFEMQMWQCETRSNGDRTQTAIKWNRQNLWWAGERLGSNYVHIWIAQGHWTVKHSATSRMNDHHVTHTEAGP